jgi:hypothetical protein
MSYIPPSDSQNILNASGVIINPSTEESVILLRRMVKLLDCIATVDSSNRQRITIENSTVTAAQTNAGNLSANVGTVAGIDPRYQFIDAARIAYATGIRNNLKFT